MKQSALIRKVSLRNGFLKRLREEGTRTRYGRNGTLKRIKPMKKISRSKRKRMAVYFAVTAEFLKRDENSLCQICTRRREAGEDILVQPSSEIHHRNGRAGKLLIDERFWIPSCRSCRNWPHEHPKQAREMGLLCSAPQWNTSVPINGTA